MTAQNGQGRAHGGRNAVASVCAVFFSLYSPNEETRAAWEAARGLEAFGKCRKGFVPTRRDEGRQAERVGTSEPIWRSQRSHGDRASGRERVSAGGEESECCRILSGMVRTLPPLFPHPIPYEPFFISK